MNYCFLRRAAFAGFVITACCLAGCGSPYRVAEVDGVVQINGKPGHKIFVQFFPDIDKGSKGPMSSAETDNEGRFTLKLQEGGQAPRPGALVGWHKVGLGELQMAASDTGFGVPDREKQEYLADATTHISQEIKLGKQAEEIKIP